MRLSQRLAIFLFGSAVAAVVVGMIAVYFLIMPRFFAYEEEVVRGDVETVEMPWCRCSPGSTFARGTGPRGRIFAPGLTVKRRPVIRACRTIAWARWNSITRV